MVAKVLAATAAPLSRFTIESRYRRRPGIYVQRFQSLVFSGRELGISSSTVAVKFKFRVPDCQPGPPGRRGFRRARSTCQ